MTEKTGKIPDPSLNYDLKKVLEAIDGDPAYNPGDFAPLNGNDLLKKAIRDSASATQDISIINKKVYELLLATIVKDQVGILSTTINSFNAESSKKLTSLTNSIDKFNTESGKLYSKLNCFTLVIAIATVINMAVAITLAVLKIQGK